MRARARGRLESSLARAMLRIIRIRASPSAVVTLRAKRHYGSTQTTISGTFDSILDPSVSGYDPGQLFLHRRLGSYVAVAAAFVFFGAGVFARALQLRQLGGGRLIQTSTGS